jgi:hypothetical protein
MRLTCLRTLAALFCCTALLACAAAPASGRSYRGVLHLKGNAPFVQPVLEDEHGKLWQLEGVDKTTASELQNQRVEVEGEPSAESAPPRPPVLRVTRIRVLPAAH